MRQHLEKILKSILYKKMLMHYIMCSIFYFSSLLATINLLKSLQLVDERLEEQF
jgi:hypothetical protein